MKRKYLIAMSSCFYSKMSLHLRVCVTHRSSIQNIYATAFVQHRNLRTWTFRLID